MIPLAVETDVTPAELFDYHTFVLAKGEFYGESITWSTRADRTGMAANFNEPNSHVEV